MSILVDENTRVLVQGITGKEGSRATKEMLDYGTKILCGVTPGKGGQEVEGKPVYNSVKEALEKHLEVNMSFISVPPVAAKSAAIEAITNGIKLVLILTETIPIHDTAEIIDYARKYSARVIGPSSIGIISPGKCKIGSIGGETNISYLKGNIGVISKSGGMSSETAMLLKQNGYGCSTVVGIGGDVISGTDFVDCLELFEKDPETNAIVLFAEIGGAYEEKAAEYIKDNVTKPVVAFVSGKFAGEFENISLGHAGAIIEDNSGTRESKVKAFKAAGVKIAELHHEIINRLKEVL